MPQKKKKTILGKTLKITWYSEDLTGFLSLFFYFLQRPHQSVNGLLLSNAWWLDFIACINGHDLYLFIFTSLSITANDDLN